MTDEKFQQLIQESLLRQQKRREKEEKKKVLLREKKKKAREKAKRQEKAQQKQEKPQFQPISRAFSIYATRYAERETAITDIYLSREELQEAEKRGEGKLNWRLLDKLIEEGKKWNEEHFKH